MRKEKLIEEMKRDVNTALARDCSIGKCLTCEFINEENCEPAIIAEHFYNAGYRKQSGGCTFCGTTIYVKTVRHTMPLCAPITRADELKHELLNLTGEIYLPIEMRFCPLCGAETKGGAEQ